MINSAIWQSLVSTLFSLLLNLSFQIGVIVGLTLLCIRLMRIRSSDVRHLMWIMVLLSPLLLVPLEFSLSEFSFSPFEPVRVVARVQLSAGEQMRLAVEEPSTLLALILEILVLLWIVGAAVLLSRLVYSGFLRHRLLKSSIKVETGIAAQKLSELKERMGIGADVRLFASERLPTPASFGCLRPVVMLPMHFLATLTGEQLEMILAHELVHIKRCDYLICLSQRIMEAIFFFHPLFYYASRQLDKEREYICDDWTVKSTKARENYAECLVQMIEAGGRLCPVSKINLVSLMGNFKDILKRIDRIMESGNIRTKLSRKSAFSILIGMCILVALVSIVKLVQNDATQNETVLNEVTSKPETIPSQEVGEHKVSAVERDVFSKQKLYEEETAALGPIEPVGVPSRTSSPFMEKAAEGLGRHSTTTEPKEQVELLKVESTNDVQTPTLVSPSQSKVTSLIQTAMRPPGPGEPLSRTHWIGGEKVTFGHPVSREEAVAMSELLQLRRLEAELKILKINDVLRKTEENRSRTREKAAALIELLQLRQKEKEAEYK